MPCMQLRRWAQQAQREGSSQMEALGHNFLRSLETLTREQRNRWGWGGIMARDYHSAVLPAWAMVGALA